MIIGPNQVSALRLALIFVLASALLTACGFRARGSIELPQDFRSIYVQAPLEIKDELAIFLDSGGAKIVETPTEADATIKVRNENYEQRVVAVNATTGKAREFELLYTLNFSVRMKDGTMLLPSEQVVVRRIYVFDPNAVIGATQNVAELQRDMRRDAAERIIRITEASLGK